MPLPNFLVCDVFPWAAADQLDRAEVRPVLLAYLAYLVFPLGRTALLDPARQLEVAGLSTPRRANATACERDRT